MTILLDAAGTLIHPAESVGAVYARRLDELGLVVDPDLMEAAFRRAFATAPPPSYNPALSGHDAERHWWRHLVSAVLRSLGGDAARLATVDLPAFDRYFNALFTHYAAPSAWALSPEVVEFLEHASRLAPLAVVSNFDDRLQPILDGLGIGPAFELVLTSADARARKPDRAIFDLALDRLNCAPTDSLHCGDNLTADLHGATAAGLMAFHLQRPAQTLFDFAEFCRRNGKDAS